MPKPMRVAGEVDGWCTRCRLLLNHRIVSMDRGKPHQVECLTCRTTHMWRAAAPGTAAGSGGRSQAAGEGRARAAGGRPAATVRHEKRWEEAIAGKGVRDFKTYSVSASFAEGDLLRHKKFGDGLVTRVIDAGKVEVLFRDEARTLAHGLVA